PSVRPLELPGRDQQEPAPEPAPPGFLPNCPKPGPHCATDPAAWRATAPYREIVGETPLRPSPEARWDQRLRDRRAAAARSRDRAALYGSTGRHPDKCHSRTASRPILTATPRERDHA